MTEREIVNTIATDFLHDLEVVFGRARPDRKRRKFQYLQPHFAYIREENVVERIAAAFEELEHDKKLRFQDAVIEALERCVTNWLGSTRTMNVATIAYRIARESLPSDIWERLLDRRDPLSDENTANFLEQLVPLLRSWRVQLDARRINYKHVVAHVALRALPSTANWLLQQARRDADLSVRIYIAARDTLKAHWSELSQSGRDPLRLYDDLFEALLPDLPDGEKEKLLIGYGITLPIPEATHEAYGSILESYLIQIGPSALEELEDDVKLLHQAKMTLDEASLQ